MENPLAVSRMEELQSERRQLIKAEADIEQGWARLRNQQDLAFELRMSGHDTQQAERLILLLKQTLVEWERHRSLIEARVAYLERADYPFPLQDS